MTEAVGPFVETFVFEKQDKNNIPVLATEVTSSTQLPHPALKLCLTGI